MPILHRAQSVEQIAPDGRCVLDQFFPKKLDRDECRRTRYRVAAEGARVGSRGPLHQGAARRGHAERHAGCDALGDGDHVRLQAVVLAREHPPRPAHARLHFVGDDQDVVPFRELRQPLDELRRRYHVSAFALDGFEDDGCDLVG